MPVSNRAWVGFSKASALIQSMIVEGSHSSAVLDLAADLARDSAPMGKVSQAQAIWQWVTSNIYYLEDPFSDDHFQTPAVTLKRGAGDCDDQAILLGSLLRSIGIEVRLVFVFDAPPTGSPTEFPAHVYIEGNVQGQWAAMETIPVPGAGGGFYFPKFAQQEPDGYRERVQVQ